MKVLKFGGSSVGSSERIKAVLSILKQVYSKEKKFAVVFSAFQGVTDKLEIIAKLAADGNKSYLEELNELREKHIDIATKLPCDPEKLTESINVLLNELENLLKGVNLLKELTPRSMDYIYSFGERLSCAIITESLKHSGIECGFLDARKLIRTNDKFGKAEVDFTASNKLITEFFNKTDIVQIVTGFIASSENGISTTLGRGGSDYTASILGAALNAEEIQIWTDVDGIMTADPRKVVDAHSLKAVTYEEASEMSYFGAKVIYPPTMKPAMDKKIKIRIKNTFNPNARGTVIVEREPEVKFNAKGISSIDDVSIIRVSGNAMPGIEGVSARIFSALARDRIKILLITQGSSGISISVALFPGEAAKAMNALREEFKLEIYENRIETELIENLSMIAVVGEDMLDTPGITGRVLQSLGRNGINVIAVAQGSSQLNISLVISRSYLSKALNALHSALFLDRRKILNLFLIGPGLVGSSLLEYINARYKDVKKDYSTRLKIAGIANSKKMVFDKNGVELNNWKDILDNSDTKSEVEQFISKMKEMNLPNSIFIDCSGRGAIAPYYRDILDASISVTTPNKVANSGSYQNYLTLRETAARRNVRFEYSANVGAGLPIISAISEMVRNSDKITRIEAVLSGSLSYIFNRFRNEEKISQIILDARKAGFSEPDPRDDLNGLDFARKMLILIREAGFEFEPEDIKVENLIPQDMQNITNAEDFMNSISDMDDHYKNLKKKAEEKKGRLCYMGSFDGKKAAVSLECIDNTHPFFSLDGSGNIAAIYSDRYHDNPLVIQGDGAGARLTATGIFADILKISNYLGLTYG